ncbi:hypothetical protein BDV25DRAFT_145175 [Aspergillus avenaceus]|uniref:Uncharacterized protein n=1 Tax=Aspergillus avenaceus TaxID=36643 RepID=A0A5N6TF08_ASPAV|nr:hypothetical protein BDV25DRAFT_145175 [Aspergillus avenaceus]
MGPSLLISNESYKFITSTWAVDTKQQVHQFFTIVLCRPHKHFTLKASFILNVVNFRSVTVATAVLGVYATALPTGTTPGNEISASTLTGRCVPDDPTSCGTGSIKRDAPQRRCLPDDPTSCDPGDFGSTDSRRDVPQKRCIPDDPTSCGPADFGSTGSAKREAPQKRCIPDDPTSCDPSDFGSTGGN